MRRLTCSVSTGLMLLAVGLTASYDTIMSGLVSKAEAQETPITPPNLTLSEKVLAMERGLEGEFETYFEREIADVTQPPEEIAQTLARLGEETNTNPAVIWAIPRGDHLHLVLITSNGEPIVRDLYDVSDDVLRKTVQDFQQKIQLARSNIYLSDAQQLHEWLLQPFEDEFLEPQDIDTILFCLGNGLRGLPLAALHDGEQFLIEKYRLTRIPAFNLIEHTYTELQTGRLLAMGASEFENQTPLPAVPIELSQISELLNTEENPESTENLLLNEEFVLPNLETLLSNEAFDIVHLATHASFQPGNSTSSYIQFWDQRLNLSQMPDIPWNASNPSGLELLVLSACETAVGDDEAELGFAGLALQSGVKSAVASLWRVSDAATLALMTEFYRQLTVVPTRAEALRQTQLQFLQDTVRFEDNALQFSRGEAVTLPEEISGELSLSHPFYWAGFTMISSPW